MPAPAFDQTEWAAASRAALALKNDATTMAALRAHVVTAAAGVGLPGSLPDAKRDLLVAAAVEQLFGVPGGGPTR